MRGCIALLGLASLATILVAQGPAPTLPAAEYPKVVDYAITVIREALGKENPDKRSADRARMAAVMIAAYAQQDLGGADAAQRAGVRDAALEVAALIKNKEYAKAIQRAESLPKLPADSKAKKEKVKLLGAIVDFDDVMTQFRQPPRGGLGIEGRFEELEALGGAAIPAKEMDELLARQAYLTAVAAELTAAHVPEDKKDMLKEWQKLSAEMRQHALALGAATRAKDGKAAFRALERLNRSCVQCHKAFR